MLVQRKRLFTSLAAQAETKYTRDAFICRQISAVRIFTITAQISRAHWLIFIVNKRTDT